MNNDKNLYQAKDIGDLRTMLDIHYLYPDVIYRFNALLHLNWKKGGLGTDSRNKKVYLTPAFFSKHSRTFNWISIGSSMWKWSESKDNEALSQMLNLVSELKRWMNEKKYKNFKGEDVHLNDRQKTWENILGDLPGSTVFKDAKSYLNGIINDDFPADKDIEQLQRSLLAIYSGIHQSVNKNFEGLFYYFLYKCGSFCKYSRMDMLIGEMFNPGEGESQPPFHWFKIENPTKHEQSCDKASPIKDAAHCSLKKYIPLYAFEQQTDVLSRDHILTHPPDLAQMLSEGIFLENLLLIPKGSDTIRYKERIWHNKNVVLLPLYDVWVDDWGMGGIMAVFAVFFESSQVRQDWLKHKYPQFRRCFSELAAEISASAKTLATAELIMPPYDLVRHFLKVLPFMQDWESAAVFENKTLIYRYRRKQEGGKSNKWLWERDESQIPDDEKEPSIPVPFLQESGSKFFMWWTAGENGTFNYWSKLFIPDIGEEELAKFGCLAIRFEFPKACYIPPDETARKFLSEEYLRQQFDLMRILIPKVRSRRAALRTAVSAIMGRNMSHNIGSHVLARYSSAAGRVGEQRTFPDAGNSEMNACEWGVEDHRSVLLHYLQRRMDFIAEVATAEKSFWTQPLSLSRVLSELNLDAERERTNKKENRIETRTFEPILLRYITGKEGINATVVMGDNLKNIDPYFSCPGGEVGAHALYVILENIIRNSARHNKDKAFPDNLITLNVGVIETKEPDLWCVIIIDCQSSAERCDEINRIIKSEPILNQDGSPNQKSWGIREMQICAHYLRGLPMGDLEGDGLPLPVLEAVPHVNETGECLAYRIYLQRAKLCALVLSKKPESLKGQYEFIKSKGIEIFDAVPDRSRIKGYSHLVIDSGVDEITDSVKLRLNINSIPHLHLPVRTCVVESKFSTDLFDELLKRIQLMKETGVLSQEPNLEDWLEPLHRRIWEGYRDKRGGWKDKVVRALVGWQNACSNNVSGDSCQAHFFCHTIKDSEQYLNFGNTLEQRRTQIGCAWMDHGDGDAFEEWSNPNLLSAAKKVETFGQPFVFAETLDSQSPHKKFLESRQDKPDTGNEIVAAALARVIVLDERVQNELQDQNGSPREYRSGIHYKTLWPCMGIWVPGKDVVDLNKPDFDKINRFLKNPTLQTSQLPPDFLVLHLTILENIKLAAKCEAETLRELLKGTSAEHGCEIVIVTGRGVPSLTRHNDDSMILQTRYLPISALLGYLLAQPSKLALMRALWSAAAAS